MLIGTSHGKFWAVLYGASDCRDGRRGKKWKWKWNSCVAGVRPRCIDRWCMCSNREQTSAMSRVFCGVPTRVSLVCIVAFICIVYRWGREAEWGRAGQTLLCSCSARLQSGVFYSDQIRTCSYHKPQWYAHTVASSDCMIFNLGQLLDDSGKSHLIFLFQPIKIDIIVALTEYRLTK